MEDIYFIKKFIANNEDKKVVDRPTIKGGRLNEEKLLKDVMNSTTAAREMAGIPKRKENFAASLLSQPNTKAVEIVTPDRETPGIIAKA